EGQEGAARAGGGRAGGGRGAQAGPGKGRGWEGDEGGGHPRPAGRWGRAAQAPDGLRRQAGGAGAVWEGRPAEARGGCGGGGGGWGGGRHGPGGRGHQDVRGATAQPAGAEGGRLTAGSGFVEQPGGPRFRVVVNAEGQYSIWPADRDPPPGWTADGFAGPEADCLAHIDQVWTDMRPRSARRDGEPGA